VSNISDYPISRTVLLASVNTGPHSNGSQFFITTVAASGLDGIFVVFGRVISGKDVIKTAEDVKVGEPSYPYRPIQDVTITDCGEVVEE
jgi:cyclophilin family peptidyl-prolyl cis-trans isomerase